MAISYWCVLIAALMPYLFTGIAKFGGRRYNNHVPREFLEGQQGFRKRAHWVQLNSFEAFPAFAAGVIIAHQLAVAAETINLLAVSFVLLRLVYGVCYLADQASLRSLVWMAALGCTVALYIQAGLVI